MFALSPRGSNGTSNSRRLHHPPPPWVQQTRKSRETSERNHFIENDRRANCQATCVHDFLDVTERRYLHNEAVRLVNLAVEKEENRARDERQRLEIEQRERQADKLRKEHQKKLEEDLRIREENLKALNANRERERQQFIEQKKLQQFLNNCDEIRLKYRHKLLEDSKACQLLQMEEKKTLQQIKKDEERMWLEVNKRAHYEQVLREQTEEKIRSEQESCVIQTLNDQVREKQKQTLTKRETQAEELRINQLKSKEFEESEKRKSLDDIQRKKTIAADLKKQNEYNQIRKREFEERELEREKQHSALVRRELEREKMKIVLEKQRIRDETFKYLEYLTNMRADTALVEVERDRIVDMYRKKINEETFEKRKQLKEQKLNMNRRAYDELWKQISENRQQKLDEYNQQIQEAIDTRKAIMNNGEIEKRAAYQRREEKTKYGNELKQQTEFANILKKKADEENQKYLQKLEEDQEAYMKMTQKFLENDIDILPLHPNYRNIVKHQD